MKHYIDYYKKHHLFKYLLLWMFIYESSQEGKLSSVSKINFKQELDYSKKRNEKLIHNLF